MKNVFHIKKLTKKNSNDYKFTITLINNIITFITNKKYILCM
jgi:hypothetical protein